MSLTQSPGGQADWRQRITAPPDLLTGKASFRELSVEVVQVLRARANGVAVPDLLRAYPELEEADIAACLAYAADLAALPSAEDRPVAAGLPGATIETLTSPPVPSPSAITLETGILPPSP